LFKDLQFGICRRRHFEEKQERRLSTAAIKICFQKYF